MSLLCATCSLVTYLHTISHNIHMYTCMLCDKVQMCCCGGDNRAVFLFQNKFKNTRRICSQAPSVRHTTTTVTIYTIGLLIFFSMYIFVVSSSSSSYSSFDERQHNEQRLWQCDWQAARQAQPLTHCHTYKTFSGSNGPLLKAFWRPFSY